MRRRTAVLLAIVALLVAPLVAPAAASPQPRPVCPVCGDALEETVGGELPTSAGGTGSLDLAVSGGAVVIDVRADGAAEWTVRNRLASAATARYLREHPRRRHDLLAAALREGGPGWPASVADVRTGVDGRTLVVRFRHAGFAERRPGGVVFSDYFFVVDDRRWFRLTVDRLTVRPPAGYVFTNRPEGPSTDADGVTWTGEEYGPSIVDVYLAMAPSESAAATLATRAALAGATLPYLVGDLRYVLPGVVLLGVLVRRLDRWSAPRGDGGGGALVDRAGLPRALLVGGLVLAVHPFYAPVVPLLGGLNPSLLALGLVYAAAGGVASWPRALPDHAATTRLVALPVAVVVLVALGRYLASLPAGRPVLAEFATYLPGAAPALVPGSLLAYGDALERGADPRRWAVAVAGVLLVLGLSWLDPVRPSTLVTLVEPAVLLGGAVVSVVTGYPLFVLGRAVARDGGEDAESPGA